jgi:hypothetical protein
MSLFNHGDILGHFSHLPPGTDLFFLPCRDNIVDCRVRLSIAVAGSMHPAASAILNVLASNGEMSIDELAEETGALGKHGLRFTAELIARLCEAQEVERPMPSMNRFKLSPTAAWQGGMNLDVVELDMCYLPRSRQFSQHIPAHRSAARSDVNWWSPPDEEALYAEDSLIDAIHTACHDYVASSRDISPWMERESGSEKLERCRLLSRRPQLTKAEILDLNISLDRVIHRCFFVRQIFSTQMRSKVYRLHDSVLDSRYSQYFEEAVSQSPEFLKSMLSSAINISRH